MFIQFACSRYYLQTASITYLVTFFSICSDLIHITYSLQLMSQDKLAHLLAANTILKNYAVRAPQLYCQRIWKQFFSVSNTDGVDVPQFNQFLEQVSALRNEELSIVFAARMLLHEVMSGRASTAIKSFDQPADESTDFLFDSCLKVPRSLYLRVMRAALLRHLAEVDGVRFQPRLYVLAWTLPPFGSWTTFTPSCVDDWLDPADEVFVDSSSALSWEEQVGMTPNQILRHSWNF